MDSWCGDQSRQGWKRRGDKQSDLCSLQEGDEGLSWEAQDLHEAWCSMALGLKEPVRYQQLAEEQHPGGGEAGLQGTLSPRRLFRERCPLVSFRPQEVPECHRGDPGLCPHVMARLRAKHVRSLSLRFFGRKIDKSGLNASEGSCENRIMWLWKAWETYITHQAGGGFITTVILYSSHVLG